MICAFDAASALEDNRTSTTCAASLPIGVLPVGFETGILAELEGTIDPDGKRSAATGAQLAFLFGIANRAACTSQWEFIANVQKGRSIDLIRCGVVFLLLDRALTYAAEGLVAAASCAILT